MKTMTCRQLGGACELTQHGQSADEVIKAQDRHLRETVAGGGATHGEALAATKARWRRPISAMGWYRDVKRRFAELPEDPTPTE